MRSWKSFDRDAMERLHEKGYISNPVSKAKSVAFTEEGWERSKEAFQRLFGNDDKLTCFYQMSATVLWDLVSHRHIQLSGTD